MKSKYFLKDTSAGHRGSNFNHGILYAMRYHLAQDLHPATPLCSGILMFATKLKKKWFHSNINKTLRFRIISLILNIVYGQIMTCIVLSRIDKHSKSPYFLQYDRKSPSYHLPQWLWLPTYVVFWYSQHSQPQCDGLEPQILSCLHRLIQGIVI